MSDLLDRLRVALRAPGLPPTAFRAMEDAIAEIERVRSLAVEAQTDIRAALKLLQRRTQ